MDRNNNTYVDLIKLHIRVNYIQWSKFTYLIISQKQFDHYVNHPSRFEGLKIVSTSFTHSTL